MRNAFWYLNSSKRKTKFKKKDAYKLYKLMCTNIVENNYLCYKIIIFLILALCKTFISVIDKPRIYQNKLGKVLFEGRMEKQQ